MTKISERVTHYIDIPGVYIKETKLVAGEVIGKHVHDFDHYSVLSQGSVKIVRTPVTRSGPGGSYTEILHAPAVINVVKHTIHAVVALEPSTWLCIQQDLGDL